MKLVVTSLLSSVMLLAACDSSNPFLEETETEAEVEEEVEEEEEEEDEDTDTTFTIEGGGVPDGVDGPVVDETEAVIRYEELDEDGGGRAEEFSYDSTNDTFSVDNLAFDGEDAYTREPIASIASLGPNEAYAVYNAAVTVPDALDDDPVSQIVPYRAIVGISNATTAEDAPRTSFAIVRTGGFTNYGFGGFVYQREGGVVLPTTGQARFNGDYAGVRIFDSTSGLEYVEGDMYMDLDFDDPTDAVAGVKGLIYNRVAYDSLGNEIDSTNGGITLEDQLPLPNISFVLDGDNGNASSDGDLTGELALNSYLDEEGTVITYESGVYYAIVAGDTTQEDGGEIVGIAVITSSDPRDDGIRGTAQETGGFILYRDDDFLP